MKFTLAVPVAATLAAVANAQLFPDCVHGPLANTTVCDVNASMSPMSSPLSSHH